jgi:predicted dinucleotide-binding enzyme
MPVSLNSAAPCAPAAKAGSGKTRSLVPGEHNVFICGDDADAKAKVTELVASFGWQRERIVDLGGIEASREIQMYLVLWLRLMGALGSGHFNIRVVR